MKADPDKAHGLTVTYDGMSYSAEDDAWMIDGLERDLYVASILDDLKTCRDWFRKQHPHFRYAGLCDVVVALVKDQAYHLRGKGLER